MVHNLGGDKTPLYVIRQYQRNGGPQKHSHVSRYCPQLKGKNPGDLEKITPEIARLRGLRLCKRCPAPLYVLRKGHGPPRKNSHTSQDCPRLAKKGARGLKEITPEIAKLRGLKPCQYCPVAARKHCFPLSTQFLSFQFALLVSVPICIIPSRGGQARSLPILPPYQRLKSP